MTIDAISSETDVVLTVGTVNDLLKVAVAFAEVIKSPNYPEFLKKAKGVDTTSDESQRAADGLVDFIESVSLEVLLQTTGMTEEEIIIAAGID